MSEKQAYSRYCLYLSLSLILTIIGAFIGEKFLMETILNMNIFIELIIVIGSLLLVSYSKNNVKKIMFAVFCFVEGLFLSPLLMIYTSTSLITAIGLTLVVTIICSVIGSKVTLKESFGKYLFIVLICVLIYTMVSLFIPLPSINLIIMILFSLYIVYDMNVFISLVRYNYISNDDIINSVIQMYLNILNLLITILDIIGKEK